MFNCWSIFNFQNNTLFVLQKSYKIKQKKQKIK
jgi:hypothetical protein